MLKKENIVGFLLILLTITSCTLLPWVKDKNDIYDWSYDLKEDAVYYYKTTYYYSWRNSTTTDNFEWKITDYTLKTNKKVYTINDDGQTRFLIVDKDNNLIFYGKDEFFSGFTEDEVYLQTPVEIDNSWIYKSETRKISAIDTTVEINGITFDDVVKVKIMENDYYGYLYWSISKGLIYKYLELTNGDYYKLEVLDIN